MVTSRQNGLAASQAHTMNGRGDGSKPLAPAAGGGGGGGGQPGGKVQLKRTFGLFNCIAINIGIVVGSGIFVSPRGVLAETGSVGLALVVWAACGVICLIGAHCFAELGTCISSAGGMYAYAREAFGDLPAFLYLWSALIVVLPAANAIIALTCARYILQPLFTSCEVPDVPVRLIAATVIALLTYVNANSVLWATRVQDVFTVIKTLALVLIIITGIVVLCQGKTDNFNDPFKSSNTNPGNIALALYSGLFSYSGWYAVTFLVEELKQPERNLPLSIWISMPVITFIYFMTNVAYFAVLTPNEILTSDAVALTFANRMYGVVAWVMSIFVAFSTFGSLNGCILTVARMFFEGARKGHLPDLLALLQVNQFTPVPAILFQGFMSTLMLITNDVYLLINYVTFVESLSFAVSIAALFYFRIKRPNMHRPIKVHLFFPITFMGVCIFLIVFPLYASPFETFTGMAICATGIPVYIIGVTWKNKPDMYKRKIASITIFVQKLFMLVPED